jgi:APA family basic amino acid/polyamine antiporter
MKVKHFKLWKMSFLNFFSSDYFGHYGWVVFCEAGVVFFAFIGFDAVSTAAAKIHKRMMPLVF